MVSSGQIGCIHALLAKVPGLGDKRELAAYKKNLVRDYTDGKEISTKKLTWKQAKEVIIALERLTATGSAKVVAAAPEKPKKVNNVLDTKRKKVLHYCHLMNWYEGWPMQVAGDTKSIGDLIRASKLPAAPKKVLDMQRLNNWCLTYGKYKKALNDHSNEELSVLIIQIEKAYQAYLNAV